MIYITSAAFRRRAIAICGPGRIGNPALIRAEDAVAAAVAAMDERTGR